MGINYIQPTSDKEFVSFSPKDDDVWEVINISELSTDWCIPKDAVLDIQCENQGRTSNFIGLRAVGSTLSRFSEVNAGGHMSILVKLDGEGKLEAYSENADITSHHVMGYFDGVEFTEKMVELK